MGRRQPEWTRQRKNRVEMKKQNIRVRAIDRLRVRRRARRALARLLEVAARGHERSGRCSRSGIDEQARKEATVARLYLQAGTHVLDVAIWAYWRKLAKRVGTKTLQGRLYLEAAKDRMKASKPFGRRP